MDFTTYTIGVNTRFSAVLTAVAMIFFVAASPVQASNDKESACVDQARTYITDLLPHAYALVGVKLDVKSPNSIEVGAHTLQLRASWREDRPGHGSIVIYPDFCTDFPYFQRATIAHELGHAIDNLVFTGTADVPGKPWRTRRAEIAATAWALSIYRHAELNVLDLEGEFSDFSTYWAAVQSYPTARP